MYRSAAIILQKKKASAVEALMNEAKALKVTIGKGVKKRLAELGGAAAAAAE